MSGENHVRLAIGGCSLRTVTIQCEYETIEHSVMRPAGPGSDIREEAGVTADDIIRDREEEIIAALVEGREAAQRLLADHADLMLRFPDQWVAVSRDGVVAHDENLNALIEAYTEAGYDRNQVAVKLLETEPRLMIL